MKTFKIITEDSAHAYIVRIVGGRLRERGLAESENAELTIKLLIDPFLRADSYRLVGTKESITVSADSNINLLAGCGYLLLHSRFDENGITPTERRGTVCPDCSARGVYLATHFHTYYQTAPIEEVMTYLEDMALIGINELNYPIPGINLKGASEEEIHLAYVRCAEVMKYAKSLGMRLLGKIYTSCVADAPMGKSIKIAIAHAKMLKILIFLVIKTSFL